MSHLPNPDSTELTICQSWSQVVTTVLTYQWNVWNAHYEVGVSMLDSVFGMSADRPVHAATATTLLEGPASTATEPKSAAAPNLEQLAAERLRRGLAPPREVYQVPYRDRLNWTDFPDWARPADPELFEGCSHEG